MSERTTGQFTEEIHIGTSAKTGNPITIDLPKGPLVGGRVLKSTGLKFTGKIPVGTILKLPRNINLQVVEPEVKVRDAYITEANSQPKLFLRQISAEEISTMIEPEIIFPNGLPITEDVRIALGITS